MPDNTIQWDKDADGIVTLTMDDPSGSTNVMNEAYIESMGKAVDRLVAEKDSITGVVVASAKKTFFAGGDVKTMIQARPEDAGDVFNTVETIKRQLRTLETLGKPVVAAINGAALGGGLEIALACHHRIAADVKGSQLGLPEVTLGLLPGGGGVTRTVRMFGIQNAFVSVLAQGTRLQAGQGQGDRSGRRAGGNGRGAGARRQGLDKGGAQGQPRRCRGAAVGQEGLQDARRHPVVAGSGGDFAVVPVEPAQAAQGCPDAGAAGHPGRRGRGGAGRLRHRQPHREPLLRVVGHRPGRQEHDAGVLLRPAGHQCRRVSARRHRQDPDQEDRCAGCGHDGRRHRLRLCQAGYEVVLKDVSLEAAAKGKGYSEKLEAKALERGRTTQERSDALLARITPTADAADFKGVDFVIEAVFENQELKHKVFGEIEDIVEPNAILGSNTSTLPITGLATGVKRQEDFIGIHFFSPVDKMPLVEIIKGEKTSDEALARVFDYTLAIGKTPIVVNDSRGFFTSRVIGTFVNEALAMLGEGVEPASIEQAGSQAGYPAPPLQLSDELNLELMHKIAVATRKGVEDAGGTYQPHPAEAVVEKMIELGRSGRLKGAGFYEYADGKRSGLWPGLRETFKSGSSQPPLQDMIDRMLFAEALETQKCLDEGVLTSTADANIGSIMGIGFPPWTGGSAQFIVGYSGPAGTGKAAFVARARELAAAYGDRFLPPESLLS